MLVTCARPIALVLVDPHPVVLDGLRRDLQERPEFEIRAYAQDGEAALQAVLEWQPDFIVMELLLAKRSGLSLIQELQLKKLKTQPIVFTGAPIGDVMRAIDLGVRGLVSKNKTKHILAECIHAVHDGQSWLDKDLTAETMSLLVDQQKKNIEAAKRLDALMNRLFIEPTLGLGYPEDTIPILRKMRSLYEPGDEKRMVFDFDFIGIQYYFRTIARKSLMPGLHANQVPASKRGVPVNQLDVEVYPNGLYLILKQFSKYKGIKSLIISENGTCVIDKVENGQVHDQERVNYFKEHLSAVLKAKKDGINVNGYFVWSPTDNFEWDKGFRTRFGLVYVDFTTLERTMKDSGFWFKEFLK